jgi:hypothetical protein
MVELLLIGGKKRKEDMYKAFLLFILFALRTGVELE